MQITVNVAASVENVWEALTRPELIKRYLFGTSTETDWEPGSPIYFRGIWEGKEYEDKGKVLEVRKHQRISYTHWSSFSEKPDRPENSVTIIYDLRSEAGATAVTVSQDCLEQEQERCEANWRIILDGLKKLFA